MGEYPDKVLTPDGVIERAKGLYSIVSPFSNITIVAPTHPRHILDMPQYPELYQTWVKFWISKGAQVIESEHLSKLLDASCVIHQTNPPVKHHCIIAEEQYRKQEGVTGGFHSPCDRVCSAAFGRLLP